jgi:hypothetical protein
MWRSGFSFVGKNLTFSKVSTDIKEKLLAFQKHVIELWKQIIAY